MKHAKELLILLVIVFLLVGLGTLAAKDTTQNNTNIKKNTDITRTNNINKDTIKTPETQNRSLEKEIQKTQKNENKKQDTIINNYNELKNALNSGSGTTTLNIAKDIGLDNSLTISNSITMLRINGNGKKLMETKNGNF